MASVRKRKWTYNGTVREAWIVEYRDGAGKVRTITERTKKDAERRRFQVEAEIERGEHILIKKTVLELCDDFLRLQDQRVRDGTIGRPWRRIIERYVRLHVLPYIGARIFSELQSTDAEHWWVEVSKAGTMNVQTRKSCLEVLRQIEDMAVRRGYGKRRVFAEFRPERAAGRRTIATFTVDDVKALIEALKHKPRWIRHRMHATMKVAVYLAAFCGLRRGEIFGLKAENVDFDRRLIKVRNSLTNDLVLKGPKTRSGIRDVPMPGPVEAVLREWWDTYYRPNPHGLLLTTENDAPVTMSHGFYNAWGLLLQRAGLQEKGEARPFHFHALRHFAASWMLEGRLSPPDVAGLLGHRTFDVTLQVYAHSVFSGSHRHDALDRMASALVAAPQTITLEPAKTRQEGAKSLIS